MDSSSGCVRRGGVVSLPAGAGKGASVSPPESRSDQRFLRTHRLTARRQFLAVYERGRRIRCNSFTVFALPNELDHCRLGITATRKIGNAVQRNRVKRRLREIFRRNRTDLVPPLDLVINAYAQAITCNPADLERDFLSGFRRLARGFER